MRWIVLTTVLVCLPLAAHPLDDQAQMASEVVIAGDQRLEYILDFRYMNTIASMTEFANGLDADNDGLVTELELKRRYIVLVDELTFELGIKVDGQTITLEPDFDRFEFHDLNKVEPLRLPEGVVASSSARIHYRFIFYWEPEQPLTPGEHTVEYYFTGRQTTLHTPEQQMVAIDARTEPRKRITNVTYGKAMEVFPKLTFTWDVPHRLPAAESVNGDDSGKLSAGNDDDTGEQAATISWGQGLAVLLGIALCFFGLMFIERWGRSKSSEVPKPGLAAGVGLLVVGGCLLIAGLVWPEALPFA